MSLGWKETQEDEGNLKYHPVIRRARRPKKKVKNFIHVKTSAFPEPGDIGHSRLSGMTPPMSEHLSSLSSCPLCCPLLGQGLVRSWLGRIAERRSYIISSQIDPDHAEQRLHFLLTGDTVFIIGPWKKLHVPLTFRGRWNGPFIPPEDSLICVIYDAAAKGPLVL